MNPDYYILTWERKYCMEMVSLPTPYPTRYPHSQFISRYYMLGDLGQDGTKLRTYLFPYLFHVYVFVGTRNTMYNRQNEHLYSPELIVQKTRLVDCSTIESIGAVVLGRDRVTL